MNVRTLVLLLPVVLLALPSAAAAPSPHYLPQAGDEFHYYETTVVNNGQGDYDGYVNDSFINGSISVTGTPANDTDNATYQSTTDWADNQGDSGVIPSQGTFTFSGITHRYVQGTDNESYSDNGTPVWFLINTTVTPGPTFYLLTDPFNVVSTDQSFAWSGSSTGYVATIFAEGNGTYGYLVSGVDWQAMYNWKIYFDPTTGYIVGYVYTEQDTDGQGNSYTYTDTLTVTTTSYQLTSAAAPPPPPASGSSGNSDALWAGVAVLVVLVIVILAAVLLWRSRRSPSLPQHSAPGGMGFGPPPGAPPPPISLIPSQQPAVQQVVLRETVKVNCKYCGTLIDSTVTNCPNCGAARS